MTRSKFHLTRKSLTKHFRQKILRKFLWLISYLPNLRNIRKTIFSTQWPNTRKSGVTRGIETRKNGESIGPEEQVEGEALNLTTTIEMTTGETIEMTTGETTEMTTGDKTGETTEMTTGDKTGETTGTIITIETTTKRTETIRKRMCETKTNKARTAITVDHKYPTSSHIQIPNHPISKSPAFSPSSCRHRP